MIRGLDGEWRQWLVIQTIKTTAANNGYLRQHRNSVLLVVGVFRDGMVGDVANFAQLWKLLFQRFFDTVLEGGIHHATALTATTKLEHRDIVFGQLFQCDITAMGSQPRVDLVIENVVDAVFQWTVLIDLRHA